MNTRQTILAAVAILLFVTLGVWWYLGFSLEFMRFFAAEPGVDTTISTVRQSPPPGCYYQEVRCIQAPCDPVLVCPSPSGRVVSCAPATQTVKVGEAANLTAEGGDGAYEWFMPDGSRVGGVLVRSDGGPAANLSVRYDAPGIKKVTVQSPRGDGSKNVDSVACTVIVTN